MSLSFVILFWLAFVNLTVSFNHQHGYSSVNNIWKLQLESFSERLAEIGDDRAMHRYFFPNHQGGKFLPRPPSAQKQRRTIDYRYDLPELEELDNIHSPRGVLKQSLEFCAKVFGSKRSWYLVNGSSGGISMAILALRSLWSNKCKANKTTQSPPSPVFLIDRNAHKSVYDGLTLANTGAVVLPVLIDPDFQVPLGVNLKELEAALQEDQDRICGVILTRPTYQGVFLKKPAFSSLIAKIHSYGIPVLVDEAHGAHLKFLTDNQDALGCGVDVVVQSGHKALLSLSQTALLHLHHNLSSVLQLPTDLIESVFQSYFSALTTTSPNFLHLSSLDQSVRYYGSTEGGEGGGSGVLALQQAVKKIARQKQKLRGRNSGIKLLEESAVVRRNGYRVDPLKLNVRFEAPDKEEVINAVEVDDYLCNEYKIYCELNLPQCVTYILPPVTTNQAQASLRFLFQKLAVVQTLIEADHRRFGSIPRTAIEPFITQPNKWLIIPPADLQSFSRVRINDIQELSLSDMTTRRLLVSAQTIALYPPGIPLLLRGERLQEEHLVVLKKLQSLLRDGKLPTGVFITGLEGEDSGWSFALELREDLNTMISST